MATFTYEQFAYRFKNPTVDGNLDLLTDGAIIKIAADDDLQLTHSGSVGDITCSTGALDINAGTVNIKDEASSETMASFVSDGAVTITLPSSPSQGDSISFIDAEGTFDTNNLTVEPGSEKIMAQTAGDEMVVDTNNAGFALVYQDSDFGWRLKYH